MDLSFSLSNPCIVWCGRSLQSLAISAMLCPCTHRYNGLKYSTRAKDLSSKLSNVPDIEELITVGRAHQLCPFYMSRDSGKVC